MSLEGLKTWSVSRKISVSVIIFAVTLFVLNVVGGLFLQEDVVGLMDGPIGKEVTELAQESLDGKITDRQLLKEIQTVAGKIDSGILNQSFYFNVAYNILAFSALGLILGHLFKSKGVRSFRFENYAPILFLASFILAIRAPIIGIDLLKVSEMLGWDELNATLFGNEKLDVIESKIWSELFLLPNESRGWGITFIGLSLVPAIGEEIMFRGYFMDLFGKRSNIHNAIAMTAFLFALIHFDIDRFLYYFLFGVILGYTYFWGQNLLFPIIIHFLHNGIMLLSMMDATGSEVAEIGDESELMEKSMSIMAYITVGLSLAIFYMNYQRRRYLIK